MGPQSTQTRECQAVSPVVQIGFSHSLTRKRMLLPPLVPGGDTTACLVLSLSTMHGPTQSHKTVPLSKCRNAGNNVSPALAFFPVVICFNPASAFPN